MRVNTCFRFFNCICVSYLSLGFIVCESKDWDYLIFAQRWPPAVCLDMAHGKCTIPKNVTEWVIHGLWPTSIHGYPSFCNSSWAFNPAQVKSIIPELEVKWPNLMSGSSAISFWKHEWQKHGTCAATLEKLDGELKYFVNTLRLQEMYNLFDIFRNSDVLPDIGRPYILEFVEKSLLLIMGKKPKIFCRTHTGYEYPLLDTIYVCMDKKFELIDCDISPEQPCNQTYVTYLPIRTSQPTCPRFTEL